MLYSMMLKHVLVVSTCLFSIGNYGLIMSPNMVIVLTSASIDKIVRMRKQISPNHFYSMLKQMVTFNKLN